MSGKHLGGPLAAVVRLLDRKNVVKFEVDIIDGSASSLAEIFGMCSAETGNVVTRYKKAKRKQVFEARDSIENPIAIFKFGVHTCENSIEEDRE